MKLNKIPFFIRCNSRKIGLCTNCCIPNAEIDREYKGKRINHEQISEYTSTPTNRPIVEWVPHFQHMFSPVHLHGLIVFIISKLSDSIYRSLRLSLDQLIKVCPFICVYLRQIGLWPLYDVYCNQVCGLFPEFWSTRKHFECCNVHGQIWISTAFQIKNIHHLLYVGERIITSVLNSTLDINYS
jgi:hypothetical protein